MAILLYRASSALHTRHELYVMAQQLFSFDEDYSVSTRQGPTPDHTQSRAESANDKRKEAVVQLLGDIFLIVQDPDMV